MIFLLAVVIDAHLDLVVAAFVVGIIALKGARFRASRKN
jgi:hypothetical protein